MRHAFYTLYIIIATIILIGCGGKSEFRQTLESLDSVLVQSPDSVYKVLVAEESEAQQQSHADRMYYELLRADAQNKTYIDFTTDSVMKIVADYYDHHGTANEQMRAHYLLGCTYRDLGDAPMELQCFLEATEKADITKTDCDLYTLYAIYGQMADIYHYQYLPEEELKALKLCEKIALQDKDSLSAIQAYILQFRPYDLYGKNDSIISIINTAYNQYLTRKDTIRASRLLSPIIGIHIDQQRWDEVNEEDIFFEKYSGYFDGNGNIISDKKQSYYYEKGLIMLHHEKIDSALYCFNKLLKIGKKEAAYYGLLSLYEKTNKSDSVVKYAKLFAEANDSSYIGKNSEVIARMTAMYNYGCKEKIAREKTIGNAHAKTLILFISAFATIILILLLAIIGILRQRGKNKERLHKEQEKFLLKRYNETKETISALEKEKEALVEENTNIDLLQQTINRFENEKQELQNKLQAFNQITDDVEFKAWYEDFIDCNAANKLHAKAIHVKTTITIEEDLWEDLKKHIKRNCPEFLTILDAYSLNETYERIVLLNTFNFTNGEISILLAKTSQQISNIHNRLSKKMFPSSKNTRKLKQNIQEILRSKRVSPSS